MDTAEVEETLFAATDAKLHRGMCKVLSAIYCRVLEIFPVLEAARPRSKSGIQTLCSLHIALEKTKNVLQHCSECSKLYLAITGDPVLSKFDKARSALAESLRRVEDIVPQSVGCQISQIVSDLEATVFSLDPLEKLVGDQIIALLQQGKKFETDDDKNSNELESFHQSAVRLGITSSRAALAERRALKKLIERARIDEDKRKEAIVAYLLYLMRKYSKLFRNEFSDDTDSQGSGPCSPTVQDCGEGINSPGVNGHYERQFSKFSSFNFKANGRASSQMPLAPEELRCPISLQIMYDPVIIASGQTYERVCIEKWFSDGHNTCPKSQQQLSHLCLTPNYCAKALIASWCEQSGVPIPECPPDSLDLNYWRLALSESESISSKSLDSIDSCKQSSFKILPAEECCDDGKIEESKDENCDEFSIVDNYQTFLTFLDEEQSLTKKCNVVEQIRCLLKDDEEARILLGSNGFVEVLVGFLRSALLEDNEPAQEVGAMALFNLAVNNDRNKKMMLGAGVLSLLEEMIPQSDSHEPATALYLNLSCLQEAKSVIGTSKAVPFLVEALHGKASSRCKADALHALYNLSTLPSNIPPLLSAGAVGALHSLFAPSGAYTKVGKSIAVVANLASTKQGKDELISFPNLVTSLAGVLEDGEANEQEQAAACLLVLCDGSEKCSQMVLQEGVVPSLVSISVNGTARGREKAQKLLMLFREQRQREPPPPPEVPRQYPECNDNVVAVLDQKKMVSRRKIGRAFSSLWK